MADFFEHCNLNKIYRILSIIMAICWGFFAVCLVVTGFLRAKVYPVKYKIEVVQYSKEFNLPSELVFSVINTESSFNAKAVSKVGAVGLMQIKPSTATYISEKLNVYDYDLTSPALNVRFGCYYLRYLLNRFKITDTALCAYNAGEGTVSKWLNDKRFSLDQRTLISIPYKETNDYIQKIHKCLINYKKLYGKFLDKSTKFS